MAKYPQKQQGRYEGIPKMQGPDRATRMSDKLDPRFLEIRRIKPRNEHQAEVVEDIQELPLTLLVGPAGTGKTLLPVAVALDLLVKGEISKIIAVRPAIEAGDSVGYLTGDLASKMGPYLRPVLDSFEKLLVNGKRDLDALMAEGIIEITSVTYMRGRTTENCVYIIDEAQNCTKAQLKMLLTRLGENCHAVVTMDPDQCDLPDPADSASHDLWRFEGAKDVALHQFEISEVVRSGIVKTLLKLYAA